MSKNPIINSFLKLLIPENIQLTQSNIEQEYRFPLLREVDFEINSRYLQTIWVCGSYKDDLQKIIEKIKLRYEYAYIDHLFNIWLWQYRNKLRSGKIQLRLCDVLPDFITFVPGDRERRQLRGFHLPQLLAQRISEHLKVPCLPTLFKPRHTPFQASLDRQGRISNPSDAFLPLPSFQKQPKDSGGTVWLVDDVCTTGATLHFAAQQIKNIMPTSRIYGLVMASG